MYNQIYEIKDVIDSLYGCDSAYYGVDGTAIATVLVVKGYRKQSEVAREIFAKLEREIEDALRNNYAVRQKRIEKCGMDEFAQICSGKIHTLQGILDFIKELKIAYEVDSDETN